jgi:chromosome condensin MukBEF MukE localization factor
MLEHRTDRADTEDAWLNELIGPEEGKSVLAYADKRVEIWDLGRRLKQNKVRLTINWIRSAGYIPPYMDGEILPTEFTIYDSNSPDIFGHIPSGNIIRDTTCQERLQEQGSAASHEHSESDSVSDDEDDVFVDPFLG